jgi:hypothetical protein
MGDAARRPITNNTGLPKRPQVLPPTKAPSTSSPLPPQQQHRMAVDASAYRQNIQLNTNGKSGSCAVPSSKPAVAPPPAAINAAAPVKLTYEVEPYTGLQIKYVTTFLLVNIIIPSSCAIISFLLFRNRLVSLEVLQRQMTGRRYVPMKTLPSDVRLFAFPIQFIAVLHLNLDRLSDAKAKCLETGQRLVF